jgi:hypothetical protein
MFNARTKHVEIDYHFVHERVASHELFVWFLSSKDQLADIMTKSLPTLRFEFLCSKLVVIEPPSACGGRNKYTTGDVQSYHQLRYKENI